MTSLQMRKQNKPSFLIIGAQKAGTSSLHHYLSQIPTLHGSEKKELHFFDFMHLTHHNNDWYESHFAGNKHDIYFESTPSYSYLPNTAERIYKYNPKMKLIFILREPISRAYSAWNMYKQAFESNDWLAMLTKNTTEKDKNNKLIDLLFMNRSYFPSFEEYIRIESDIIKKNPEYFEPSFLRRGIYINQLEEYEKYFDKKNILIIGNKDLSEKPLGVLKNILNFLNIDIKLEDKNIDLKAQHQRAYDSKISEESKLFLEDFYRPYNDLLFNRIGEINW
ncbi:MAG: sulfotransferase domain-containing protein [Sulfuricurvum sp.]